MKNENKLALIVAFYVSKFDSVAYNRLGDGSITKIHSHLGNQLGVKASTIKNMRDEFDPYHENTRKGWHQRHLSPSRVEIQEKYKNYSEEDMYKLVTEILTPHKASKNIFSEVEKEEIDSDNRSAIEGETIERKVLSYKRNAKSASECKKRDSYTCQACGFWFEDQVVECHHLEPLAMSKETTVKLDQLVTLCPTCHSLAHNLLKRSYQDYIKKPKLLETIRENALSRKKNGVI